MKLTVVDGNNVFWRCYHQRPDHTVLGSTGKPVGGLQRSLNTILRLRSLYGVTHFAVAFDAPARNSRRRKEDDTYKGNRTRKPPSGERQLQQLKDLLEAFGVACFQHPTAEADDVLATLVRRGVRAHAASVYVATTDKDLDQIVEGVVMKLDPFTGDVMDSQDVQNKWGVASSSVPDVLALAGDPVDGVSGVAGIGMKGAAALVQRFGTAQAVKQHRAQLTPRQAKGLESANIGHLLRLVRLRSKLRLGRKLATTVVRPLDWKHATPLWEAFGLPNRI